MKNETARDLWILGGMFIAAIFLWNTFVLYPVKLFVVALHELSHGLAAILVGGKIDRIQIDYRIGGYCAYFLPGDAGFISRFITASAGYLGSMIWGSLFFLLAVRTRWDRFLTGAIAFIILILSFFVIKTGEVFGILFCFTFAGLLLAAVKWLPDRFHDLFIKFLGLISCLYVIIDIKEDLIDRSGIGSDADVIAGLLGVPRLSVPIGFAWIITAIFILILSLRYAYKFRQVSSSDH